MKWATLKWLREVGILLLIISLLFLPWYLDPSPEVGHSPFVTGLEFFATRSWPVILIYALSLLAYAISRFSTHKRASFIPLAAAGLLYFYINLWMTIDLDAPGINLDRYISSLESYGAVKMLAGIPVNCAGLLALAAGLFAAARWAER